MASYNGERYIREQIDSILNQKEIEVSLLVADDCSTDGTVQILEDYKKNRSNVEYYVNSSNLGYKVNFFKLINNAPDGYDYYALSDQDDVWLNNKLISAITFIENNTVDDNEAILYSSNLMAVDSDLNELGAMFAEKDIKKFTPYNLLLENKCTGCTAVFNEKFKQLLKQFPTQHVVVPHDTVMERIAILYGKYVFDSNSYILYRQHDSNLIGVEKKHNSKKYFDLMSGKKKSYNSQNLKDILDIYKNRNSEYLEFAKNIACYKKSLKSKLKILFFRKYRKVRCKKTLIFKIAILLNKY